MNLATFSRRSAAASALALVGVLATAGGAIADDISNSVDDTIDAAAEVMTLNVGGSNGSTQLYVTPRNDDGKQGCNLNNGSLTLGISSSNTAIATVSPSSVTFTSCGAKATLTITPKAEGSATVSATQTTNTTGGSFNLAPATFTVNVAPPANTAPSISVAGVAGGASYDKGSVPAATCQVTDAEDGNSSFAATLSAVTGDHASDGIGSQTASCSYTDAGGLTASASETYSIVDPSAPVIGHTLSPAAPDGDDGWYTSDVTLDWTVTEAESPTSLQKTGCVDQSITADQAETMYTCSATSAGGPASDSVTIKRDATAPALNLSGGPQDGATYYWGDVPPAPTAAPSDAMSGVRAGSLDIDGYSDEVGVHEIVAKVKDNAGNTTEQKVSYSVLAWDVEGFYAPVDMNKTNTVKAGSTVPLKFELFKGNSELTSTGDVKTFTVAKSDCGLAYGADDAIEQYSTGATSLRYDTVGGQFIQNWKVPTGSNLCYRVTMTAQDGTPISAFFRTK